MVSEGSKEKRNVLNQSQNFPANIPENIPVSDLLINVSFPHAASWGKSS